MALTTEHHEAAFDRAQGRCRFCGKALSRVNHGRGTGRGAHETDHSRPRAVGGTDHGRNLYAVCAVCNVRKSDMSSRAFKELMAGERENRFSRRLDYNISQVAAPAAALGALGFALLKGAHERWTASHPTATDEERRQAIWRFFILPLGIGVGVTACAIAWRMSRR